MTRGRSDAGRLANSRRAENHRQHAGAGLLIAGATTVSAQGNGYLLDPFLQSKTRRRADAYGVSVENRFRLPREVVEAGIDSVGPERIGVRLAPDGVFDDMGSPDFRDEANRR